MAWIELHQHLLRHRKLYPLASKLGVKRLYAAAHLTAMWLWALDGAPDGNLDGVAPEVLADIMEWDGDAQQLCDALVETGWLNRGADNSLLIHDWDDYAGKLLERRAKNREQMRRARQKNDDVFNTCTTRDDTCRPTQHNQTQPNQTNIHNTTTTHDTETIPTLPVDVDDGFEAVWKAYPKSPSETKQKAHAAYNRLLRADKSLTPAKILVSVQNRANIGRVAADMGVFYPNPKYLQGFLNPKNREYEPYLEENYAETVAQLKQQAIDGRGSVGAYPGTRKPSAIDRRATLVGATISDEEAERVNDLSGWG